MAPRETAWLAKLKAPAQVTAFVNVHVVPMDTERVLVNQTVLVEAGQITALGPVANIHVPANAVRIDGRGKYLMPGLSDMHAHNDAGSVAYDKLASHLFFLLADGVTAVRYLNAIAGDPQAFEKVDGLSPHVYARGFYTHAGEVRSSRTTQKLELDSVIMEVATAKAAGYDFIRLEASAVYARTTLPIIDSLLGAARRLGFPVATHSHEKSFAHTLALGAVGGSSEHLSSLWDTLGFSSWYGVSDALRPAEVDRALPKIRVFAAAAHRAGVWITPTLDCIEARYRPLPTKLMLLQRIVKTLQNAGVGLLLAGDDGRNVHSELAALVRAGLSPYQALVTGTRNPAQYMGLLDSIGTVAVGKQADLILLYGNPLQDIRHTREPAGVMLGGRWFSRAELDQRLLALPLSKSWPRFWFRMGEVIPGLGRVLERGGISLTPKQRQKVEMHVKQFEALSDSLAATKPSEYERVLQLQAGELEAMRTSLTSKQRELFDTKARVWRREQVRKGYRLDMTSRTGRAGGGTTGNAIGNR